MATLSRAVASPFSYVVSPVDVISIGAFSGVLIVPFIEPALARRATSKKTGFRMADAESTASRASWKAQKHSALRSRAQLWGIKSTIIGSTIASLRLVD